VYNQKGHGQYREVDVKKALEGLGERVDIFLAHSNPQWEPNVNTKDSHRGFSAFKTFIEQKRPSYFFHGHLHVNETQKMGRTQVICTHGYAIYDINQ
jgi:Icc-related predicted phosphoesterase